MGELSCHEHTAPIHELEQYHTHFVMVDGPNAIPFRRKIERYISETDISRDQILTPEMVLVIVS